MLDMGLVSCMQERKHAQQMCLVPSSGLAAPFVLWGWWESEFLHRVIGCFNVVSSSLTVMCNCELKVYIMQRDQHKKLVKILSIPFAETGCLKGTVALCFWAARSFSSAFLRASRSSCTFSCSCFAFAALANAAMGCLLGLKSFSAAFCAIILLLICARSPPCPMVMPEVPAAASCLGSTASASPDTSVHDGTASDSSAQQAHLSSTSACCGELRCK